ncbi:MAG TPA: phosphoribosyltransferase family protein [Stellaceae bacterium]|nr:phosphoribosyltransferase family protein [Stellaceae bacterium]
MFRDRPMFRDRKEAGERLAALLVHLKGEDSVVLALPRGGVAIGAAVAQALGAPLDIVLVRKIGVPWQPELALGAVWEPAPAKAGDAGPEVFIDQRMAAALAIPADYVTAETARQTAELERRRALYCAGRPPVEIAGKTAIVVDDGIATGATMRVALRAVRRRGPQRLVLAAPVAAAETLAALVAEADETVCVATPQGLGAIGFYYDDFHQLSDDEVIALLAAADRSARLPL